MVLEVGCGDPDRGADNEALFQQADVEVRVLTWCGGGLARSRRSRSCERLRESGGVLDATGGASLVPTPGGAPSL